jgi:para-aminobenzoate synthetase/4-amino-4-deoxychorismate lyase
VFLYHKTTHRAVYESALRSAGSAGSSGSETLHVRAGSETPLKQGGYDDVLLYNEKDELTEFTIGNFIVEMDGKLFTPPISCGLLAGTFRAHLLETGQIEDRIIHVEDLQDCTKIFLVNSVRKWQRVIIE